MLKNSIFNFRYFISVYDGISPSLLATMSLSQNIKGNTHQQLIHSLKKSNIIQSQQLLKAFLKVDRRDFISQTATKQLKHIYENKPVPISRKQTMTDVFTHAIILSQLEPHLKMKIKELDNNTDQNRRLNILDIGTGHGYLAFVLYHYIKSIAKNIKPQPTTNVLGVDIFQQCIEKCIENRLKVFQGLDENQSHSNIEPRMGFQQRDIHQLLQFKDRPQFVKFDAIIGGFFIEPKLSESIRNTLLKQDGVGIWPTLSDSGQALFKFQKQKNKQYIIQTLFSQQIVRSSVDKYFIQQGQQQEQSQRGKQDDKQQVLDKKKQNQILKSALQAKKQALKDKLKILIVKYKKQKPLTLIQMQQIPEINAILIELKKFK